MSKRMVFIITSVVVLGIFSANCLADGAEARAVPFIPQVLSILPGQVMAMLYNADTWVPYEITRNVDNVTISIYQRTLHLGGKEPGLYLDGTHRSRSETQPAGPGMAEDEKINETII